jgi:hypothetical protein
MLALFQGILPIWFPTDTFTYTLQRSIAEERYGRRRTTQEQHQEEVD